MFGCLVAGRLPQMNLHQIDATHCIFELENASAINHLCVFMLGSQAFPEGMGASVHFHWPGKGFQLLGMLSNDKPSAIFRLRGTYTSTASSGAFVGMNNVLPEHVQGDVKAVLGLSLEPLHSLLSSSSSSSSSSSLISTGDPNPSKPKLKPNSIEEERIKTYASRIATNLFDYLSSFFSDPGAIMPESVVPMGVIKRWYELFLVKVGRGGVGFLEREE